jgi:hypothetical protein
VLHVCPRPACNQVVLLSRCSGLRPC